MMKAKVKISHFSWLIFFMVLGLASCTSPDERINAQFDTLPLQDSIFLYQYGAASSSATGDCGGVFQHRWYGTATSQEEIANFYADYLSDNGWSILPGEAVKIWSRSGSDGLYRTGVTIFADSADISQEQGSYQLPEKTLLSFTEYRTIYILSMTYMSPRMAEKCFGQ
jgi:hypothetical protein